MTNPLTFALKYENQEMLGALLEAGATLTKQMRAIKNPLISKWSKIRKTLPNDSFRKIQDLNLSSVYMKVPPSRIFFCLSLFLLSFSRLTQTSSFSNSDLPQVCDRSLFCQSDVHKRQ
jgi:hypothetical protein